VSASLFGRLLFLLKLKHNKQIKVIMVLCSAMIDVQRFDVKDKQAIAFQLESLILAQNERWRQA
jgi:hypothetical protein